MKAVRSAFSERPRRRPPTRPRVRAEASVGALANQLAPGFRQESKQVKHEPALRRGSVGSIGEEDQPHPQLVQVAHYREQVAQRTPQSVELLNVDRVAGERLPQQPLQLRARYRFLSAKVALFVL